MGHAESSEQGIDAWLESDKFGDALKEVSRGNSGAAADAFVGAVVTICTGIPGLGTLTQEAVRSLRERANAATTRLRDEYERVQKEEAAERQRVAFAKLVKD